MIGEKEKLGQKKMKKERKIKFIELKFLGTTNKKGSNKLEFISFLISMDSIPVAR